MIEEAYGIIHQGQVTQVMLALTKLRYTQRISREQVAERMGVPIQRIHDFDERRVPWSTITVSFLQRYARAVGASLALGFFVQEEGEASDGELPDPR